MKFQNPYEPPSKCEHEKSPRMSSSRGRWVVWLSLIALLIMLYYAIFSEIFAMLT